MAVPPDSTAIGADMSGVIHLHNHSDFSFLDGMQRPKDMVARAVELGATAIALTDHGEVSGHIELMDACKEHGIKPIFGYEAYHLDKDIRDKPFHLTLWAMDEEGLKNLWALASSVYLNQTEGKRPRATWDDLKKYSNGLMCGSACLAGMMSYAARMQNEELALEALENYRYVFDGNFYIEIHTNKEPEQAGVNYWLSQFALKHNVPMVHAGDSHYSYKEDSPIHNCLLGIQTRKKHNEDHLRMRADYYLHSEEEVRAALAYLGKDVVERCFRGTEEVAEKVDGDIRIDTDLKVPDVPIPDEFKGSHEEYLVELCRRGFMEKLGGFEPVGYDETGRAVYPSNQTKKPLISNSDVPRYQAQLDEELKLILPNGLAKYFLTVSDYCRDSKSRMLVGPGRGSAAGSLVSWLIGITEIDPLKAGLLFERFLNEGRLGSLPDIDLDFPQDLRGAVIEGLVEKYGAEKVAAIGTVNRFGVKQALKDVAFYFGVPFKESNDITRVIDEIPNLTEMKGWAWKDIMAQVPDKDTLVVLQQAYPKVFEYASRLFGMARQSSGHASGVIVSPIDLRPVLPLRRKDDAVTTQFDMHAVERLGFLKVDILGLRTLTTLKYAMDLVEKRKGVKVDFYRFTEEDYDDPKVWEMLDAGHTLGVFQAETKGLTGLLKDMKPRSLSDLSDAVALFRPGVIRAKLANGNTMLQEYLKRRKGELPVSFPHEDVRDILSDTFGIMVYQEQIMEICKRMASYDPIEADNMRAIVGKKKADKMAAEGEKFVSRCVANGYDQEMVTHLFENIKEFGAYGFNRAHSYAYGMITYWTAWMKANYPVEFMVALLNTDPEKIDLYLRECKRMGIPVEAPDVNHSDKEFTVIERNLCADEGTPYEEWVDVIIYGLTGIKWVGNKAAETIMENRPYYTMEDFVSKMPPKNVNSRTIKILCEIGAFRGLTLGGELVHSNELRNRWENASKKVAKTKTFAFVPEKWQALEWEAANLYTQAEVEEIENKYFGFPLTADPFEEAKERLGDAMKSLSTVEQMEAGAFGSDYVFLARTKSLRTHKTQGGEMAFITLDTHSGEELEVTVKPQDWKGLKLHFKPGIVVALCAEKTKYKDNISLKAKSAMRFVARPEVSNGQG